MQQILRSHRSTLAPDNDHPFLHGPFTLAMDEYVADTASMRVIGEIPRDLAGIYVRNTHKQVHESIGMYHPFDGDGMPHAMHFEDGRATCCYSHNVLCQKGEWLFRGLKRYDMLTRRTQTLEYGPQRFGSEPHMARRIGAVDKDDGYVITFVNDMEDGRSECWVIPAHDISRGPLARIILPHRISAGTHSARVEADCIHGEQRDPRCIPS